MRLRLLIMGVFVYTCYAHRNPFEYAHKPKASAFQAHISKELSVPQIPKVVQNGITQQGQVYTISFENY